MTNAPMPRCRVRLGADHARQSETEANHMRKQADVLRGLVQEEERRRRRRGENVWRR